MDLAYIASVIGGFIGIFLLFITYMYIDKLEKMGCACAEHPFRKYIKGYCIFAIVFLAITMFIPKSQLESIFGPVGALAFFAVELVYVVLTIVFFVLAFLYVRYLMKEKCKCSEDIRRDVLYVWSIIEMFLMAAFVVIPLTIAISLSSYKFIKGETSRIVSFKNAVRNNAVNPLGALRKVPKAVKDNLKKAKRFAK
jgi:MFS family permease